MLPEPLRKPLCCRASTEHGVVRRLLCRNGMDSSLGRFGGETSGAATLATRDDKRAVDRVDRSFLRCTSASAGPNHIKSGLPAIKGQSRPAAGQKLTKMMTAMKPTSTSAWSFGGPSTRQFSKLIDIIFHWCDFNPQNWKHKLAEGGWRGLVSNGGGKCWSVTR